MVECESAWRRLALGRPDRYGVSMSRSLPILSLLLVTTAGCAGTLAPPEPLSRETAVERLREGTVTLLTSRGFGFCTGSVVLRRDHVVTAAHCLKRGPKVRLRASDGSLHHATAIETDSARDVAVLKLDHPLPARALPLGGAVAVGTPVWFLGKPKKGRRVQRARVKKLARCPRLPTAGPVVYSSYRGFPGDSGAPLLGLDGVVAVVSGGRNCQMGVPATHVRRLLARSIEPELLASQRVDPTVETRDEDFATLTGCEGRDGAGLLGEAPTRIPRAVLDEGEDRTEDEVTE